MNLLILEVYGMIIDRLKTKIKPNLRSVVCALLKHACDHKVVVRIENYRVLEKLMLAVKPNQVITQLLDHLGDKKALVRESILNMIMFGLLTFPSNEFDLKNIAATVVPTLVDPKRRVRHAALESVSILAAFLGPTKVCLHHPYDPNLSPKAVPLIRAIELLESHFEKGFGVLTAVQVRMLTEVTSELWVFSFRLGLVVQGIIALSTSLPHLEVGGHLTRQSQAWLMRPVFKNITIIIQIILLNV